MTTLRTPAIAIVCDNVRVFGHAAHAVFDGYVQAVSQVAQALPLLLPATGGDIDLQQLIGRVDGVLLTGSPSNVQPACYGGPPPPDTMMLDPRRDASTLSQIPQLVAAGVPLLGICRGLQEMNVAYGGTLHWAVHDEPGHLDHREGPHDRPLAQWYEDRHPVQLQPGGLLHGLLGVPQITVNSLHHQGIRQLGSGLRAEAHAPDGLVEAISVPGAPRFALAVQWHPEMRIADCESSRTLFRAFGDACRARAGRA